MKKIDLKKSFQDLYNPSSKEIAIVEVPRMNFLMIDGSGNPNTAQEYKDAVEALFSLSYTLKFMIKKMKEFDYVVMPLEGLWWADDTSKFAEDKNLWKWTAMIMQPEQVIEEAVDEAIEQLKKKKKFPALSRIRFESFHEGKAAQIMYFGPYSEEEPTISKIHEFIIQHKGKMVGKHNEIYLSDPRRMAPEKLKTILRQPMTLSSNCN